MRLTIASRLLSDLSKQNLQLCLLDTARSGVMFNYFFVGIPGCLAGHRTVTGNVLALGVAFTTRAP